MKQPAHKNLISLLITLLLTAGAGGLAADAYRQGKSYYSRGNFDKAREYFQKSMRANPGLGSAFYYYAVLLEKDGKKDEAIQHYRRAVAGTIEPDIRDKAYWKLVLYYRYHRDWDNLYYYSSRFLRYRKIAQIQGFQAEAERNRDPTAAAVAEHMRKGEELREAKDYDGAATHYRRALALRSSFAPARWELALLLMRADEYEKARRHLKRLVMADDDRWEFHYKLGVCNYHLDAHEAALANFEKAREHNKKPNESFQYYLSLGEGLALLDAGKYGAARESLQTSAAKRESATVLAALGRSSFWLGDMAAAEKFARQALEKEAAEPDALMVLGLVQNNARRERDALSSLKRMDESLGPDKTKRKDYYSAGYLVLGTLASRANDPQLSLRALDRVDRDFLRARDLRYLSAKKSSFQADPVFDYYYGKGLLETGRYNESLNHFQRIKPSAGVRYLMARAYGGQGDVSAVRRQLGAVFAEKPEYRTKAQGEPVFRQLAQREPTFLAFLEGREPAGPGPNEPGSNKPGSNEPPGENTKKPGADEPAQPPRQPTGPVEPVDPNAPAKLPPLDLDLDG